MSEKVKILMLGEGAVGKSSLLNRYVDEKFSENIQATLGVEYRQKILTQGEKQLIVQVWDTAERFRVITPIFYRNAQAVSLVYSVVDKNSFQQVQTWIDNLKDQIDCEQVSIVLVANKCDIAQREVTTLEGQQLAQKYQIKYFECSARTGAQVKEMYTELVQQILIRRGQINSSQGGEKNQQNIQLDGGETQPQKCC
uniref:Rab_A47 protein n=1 Tax=Paramecium tetraurelia TaxID=5888 RepID=Q3SDJ9_PARTE|nr:rab_A47 [Paramecium tetraurelia]